MENDKPAWQQSGDLELLLDAALSRYADAEPLNGLENRILNRTSLMPAARHPNRKFPLLAIGAFALSCLILVTLDRQGVKQMANPPKSAVTIAKPRVESPIAMPVGTPSWQQAAIRHRRHVPALPKRAQFPTPQPPSSQELALLRFVNQDPKAAAQAFAKLDQQANTPLEIEPLDTKPLQLETIDN